MKLWRLTMFHALKYYFRVPTRRFCCGFLILYSLFAESFFCYSDFRTHHIISFSYFVNGTERNRGFESAPILLRYFKSIHAGKTRDVHIQAILWICFIQNFLKILFVLVTNAIIIESISVYVAYTLDLPLTLFRGRGQWHLTTTNRHSTTKSDAATKKWRDGK